MTCVLFFFFFLFILHTQQINCINIDEDHSVGLNCSHEVTVVGNVWSRQPYNNVLFINTLTCHHFHSEKVSLFHTVTLHTSLETVSLSLLSKATHIRARANVGQGQSLALMEHKCITSGLNYHGMIRVLCRATVHHSTGSNRWKIYSEKREKKKELPFDYVYKKKLFTADTKKLDLI